MAANPEPAYDRLRRSLGDVVRLADQGEHQAFEQDATGRFAGSAVAVALPASVDEVTATIRICRDEGVPVVAQGGNTGLVGGSVPNRAAVVLNLRRMNDVDDVDVPTATVVAGAGATLEQVQETAAAASLRFAVDHAARGSATVGGTIATNAGGALAWRFGMARSQVTGVEAVMADGTIVARIQGLVKDNAGYDLVSLLAGSEGTLGIVTAARLKLIPDPPQRATALIGLDGIERACELLTRLREVPAVEAVEFFFRNGLELVCEVARMRPPLGGEHGVYLLVEAADHEDPDDPLMQILEEHELADAVVETSAPKRRRLWAYRERHNEAMLARGVPHKMDVSVPLASLATFVDEVPRAVAYAAPDAHTILFGHLGDGNVHVNVLGLDGQHDAVDRAVYRLVAELKGSISAEHGVGALKRQWLHLSRSAEDIDAMRAIKRALDPTGLLNPGVLLPD